MKLLSLFYGKSFVPKLNFPVYRVLQSCGLAKVPAVSRMLVFLGRHFFWVRKTFFKIICNERIVEIPLVLSAITQTKASILDVGSDESLMPLHLASLGHKVTAQDLNFYEYEHPQVTFLQGDICKVALPKEAFDYITFLSTLEHVGLGAYGEKQFERGDERALKNVYDSLKPGGKLIISVPFGKKEVSKTQRIYDRQDILQVAKQYTLEASRFFIGKNQSYWQECEEKDLAEVSSYQFTQGMGFFIFRK